MSFNKAHPECRDDEVFVSNCDNNSYRHIGWGTKRKGKVAYDINGLTLRSGWPGSFPVFVKKSEILESENGEKILKRFSV